MFILDSKLRVLLIGAHPDDIELGAGGFVHRLRRCGAAVHFLIVTHGLQGLAQIRSVANAQREEEARLAADILGVAPGCVEVLRYPTASCTSTATR